MGILSTIAQYGYYDDTYYTTTTYEGDPAVAAAVAITFGFMFFLFFIAVYVVMALCLMRIFKKAGVESWIAWVPFYNNWKMLEIGGQQGFWAVLAIIPIVNIVSAVFMYIAMYNIGLKLGKDGAYVLLAIFLAPIWFILMAVDKSPWNDAAGAPSLATPKAPTAAPKA